MGGTMNFIKYPQIILSYIPGGGRLLAILLTLSLSLWGERPVNAQNSDSKPAREDSFNEFERPRSKSDRPNESEEFKPQRKFIKSDNGKNKESKSSQKSEYEPFSKRVRDFKSRLSNKSKSLPSPSPEDSWNEEVSQSQESDPERFRPDKDEKPIPKSTTSGLPFSQAFPEDINDRNYPDVIKNFDYPDVDIRDLVKVMSELTGKNFIVDPGVKSKRITIIARSPITVAQAYKAFLSSLAVNGITVVQSGAFLKVINSKNALKDNIETYSGEYYPTSDQLITKIIKLKYISAGELKKSLSSLYSRDGDLKSYEPTNSLIISDYGSNVDRIVKIVSQLDVPGFEEKMEVIPILYAAAKDIADLINEVINKGKSSGKGRYGSVPRFRRNDKDAVKGKAVNLSFVTADDRTNSLIVLGNQSGIKKAKNLVKQLDFKVDADAQGGVYVYYIKHADAEEIQKNTL